MGGRGLPVILSDSTEPAGETRVAMLPGKLLWFMLCGEVGLVVVWGGFIGVSCV